LTVRRRSVSSDPCPAITSTPSTDTPMAMTCIGRARSPNSARLTTRMASGITDCSSSVLTAVVACSPR